MDYKTDETLVSEDRIWCVIPVYNNKDTVKNVAEKSALILKNVIVFDDGSTDVDVATLLSSLNIVVLKHETNLGKGQAILDAAKYVEENGGDYMITIDADGQHHPEDIKKFIPLISENDSSLVVGCRDFNTDNVPGKTIFGRKFANFWLRMETGVYIDDCQSGFRAYPVKYLNKMCFKGMGYDFEAEVLAKASWAGLQLKSVDINVYYPKPEKRVTHFRPFLDNFRLSLIHAMLVGRRLLPIRHKRLVPAKQADVAVILRHPLTFFKKLLTEHTSPLELAMSAAVGMFLAVLPLLFVHTIVIIYFCVQFRLNKVLAVNIQHLCMPPFMPALCIELGYYLKHGHWLTNVSYQTVFAQFSDRLMEWVLGSLIIAPIASVITGAIVFFLAMWIRKKYIANA